MILSTVGGAAQDAGVARRSATPWLGYPCLSDPPNIFVVVGIRVHELATELGLSAKQVLTELNELGEFVKSASSTVDAKVADRLRRKFAGAQPRRIDARAYGVSADVEHPTLADDGGFASALAKAARRSRSAASTRHEPGAIESAIYQYAIDPRRTRRGRYTPEETDRAQRLLKRWLPTWLDDMADWIRLTGGEYPDVAVQLSRAGLTAADAELRIGFGRIDPSRDTIIMRVLKGTLGVKDAVRQVQAFRRAQAAGS